MELNLKNLRILLISWIFVVVLLFWSIPDKKVASVIAGLGFLIIPILVLTQQFRQKKRNILVVITATAFFVFSALPIFLLRVLNWEKDFKDLSLFGIPSDFLHKASNGLYVCMLVAVLAANILEKISSSETN